MKRSEIYREAARLVALGEEFSCNAVSYAALGRVTAAAEWEENEPRVAYARLMSPSETRPLEYTDFNPNYCYPPPAKVVSHRILALCFAAAIAEWEEKHA